MLLVVIALQILLLVLVALLLLRKGAAPNAVDPRLQALPDAVVALGAKLDASDAAVRNHMAELRREQGEAATQARHAAERTSRELREEITGSIATMSKLLHDRLEGSRSGSVEDADKLREIISRELGSISERLQKFFADAVKQERQAREALEVTLRAISGEQRDASKELRGTVEAGLGTLNETNAAKLEEMRVTVDEKLQATLNDRLTTSFGQVTTHLGEVQKGLGEMKELASGVSDLKKVFSNVKSRGVVGELQLGMQLEQMFSRDQYVQNAKIKAGLNESVEFALKIPDGDGHVLLPIDAKFPREDWERLEHAYEHGTLEEQVKLGAVFERAIRTEGKRICEKYIDPPVTLPFGIMFLPTEALYAEVMRRPGLHTELQSSCHVTVAGPSSFMAILTSFQMGFRTMAIQKKGNEVWNVLGSVKKEFSKFELLMNKVENNVKTVQNTLSDIGQRTRVINKNLHNVSELNAPPEPAGSGLLMFEDRAGVMPLLATVSEDE